MKQLGIVSWFQLSAGGKLNIIAVKKYHLSM